MMPGGCAAVANKPGGGAPAPERPGGTRGFDERPGGGTAWLAVAGEGGRELEGDVGLDGIVTGDDAVIDVAAPQVCVAGAAAAAAVLTGDAFAGFDFCFWFAAS